MKMIISHEHKRIATLKIVIRNNVVDGQQLVAEPACGVGVVVVKFVVDASAVGVPEGLVVLEEETDETMGSGVTLTVEEFWAFVYEAPPPRT